MVPLSRRTLLTGVGAFAAMGPAAASEACTFVPRIKPISFSDSACRRSLRNLVQLINTAPALPDKEATDRAQELAINFDSNVSDPILNYPTDGPIEDIDLLRAWSLSDGKRDRSPITLVETSLLKSERGVAIYQFTLRRDQYHAEVTVEDAETDSCGSPSEAFYGREDASYLGLFKNNKLREVSGFDVWLQTL